MRALIAVGLLVVFACSDTDPDDSAESTEVTDPRASAPTLEPPVARGAPEQSTGVLRCRTPGLGMCSECPRGAGCETPTLEQSCRDNPGAEFGTDPCTTEGAVGRCDRPDGMRVLIYGGPPRNHSAESAQPMCEMAWRGTYTDLS